jgi:hypothetical protein
MSEISENPFSSDSNEEELSREQRIQLTIYIYYEAEGSLSIRKAASRYSIFSSNL